MHESIINYKHHHINNTPNNDKYFIQHYYHPPTTMTIICPQHYTLISSHCYHYMQPLSLSFLMGALILSFSNSLATLAGLGGGSIALVILMSFFHYLPKDASLVVFSCVLGTAAGNTFNLLFKEHNGKPLIQYHFAFVSIPITYIGSFFGVLMNKLFPSIITYSIIIIVFLASMQKTWTRFRTEYHKENEQILLHGDNVGDLHEETVATPFADERTLYIFKNLGVLALITLVLAFVRGSSRFPSVVGLEPCSGAYWFFFVLALGITMAYAYRNIQILKSWLQSSEGSKINGQKISSQAFQQHLAQLVKMSMGAGIFSGFGLGGGIFLVPMYRNLGCRPLEATSTCAFGICLTSFINCIQATSIGAIQLSQILFFVLFLGLMSYMLSKIISHQLRKRNRFSLVEGGLLLLTILAIVNIPISLYRRFVENGRDLGIIFGFGHLC